MEGILKAAHYRPEIDGLRAVAVVLVMAYHAGLPVPGGYIGVDMFFVISGYLITGIIQRETMSARFSLARFYERRARRILPALYVVIAATLALGAVVLAPAALKGLGGSATASVAFAGNLYFWRSIDGYFGLGVDRLPLLHLWSLGVEEQFYLIWPAFLLVILHFAPRRAPLLIAGGLLVSLGLAEWIGRSSPTTAFFMLPTRMWELLAGAAIAIGARPTGVEPRQPLKLALGLGGLAAIGFSAWTFDDTTRVPGLAALLPVGGTVLVLATTDAGKGVGRLLASAPFAAIGLVSYSAYLWHQPLLALESAWSFDRRSPAMSVAVLCLALGLAAVTWRFVERLWRDPRRVSRHTLVVSAVIGAGLLGAAGAGLWLADGVPQRLPPRGQALAQMEQREAAWMQTCFFANGSARSLATACRVGKGAATVAVIGDSHAAALAPALEDWARTSGQSAILFVATGCPPVFDETALDQSRKRCAPFFRDARQWLGGHANVRTVIMAARWPYYFSRIWPDNGAGGVEIGRREAPIAPRDQQALAAAAARAVNVLLRDGRRVVLIYPLPEPGWHVPEYLVKAELRRRRLPGDLSIDRVWFRNRSASAYRALDGIGRHKRLVRIYPENGLCNGAKCWLTNGMVPNYFDNNHPSHRGARLALGNIASVLAEPLR